MGSLPHAVPVLQPPCVCATHLCPYWAKPGLVLGGQWASWGLRCGWGRSKLALALSKRSVWKFRPYHKGLGLLYEKLTFLGLESLSGLACISCPKSARGGVQAGLTCP